MGKIFSCKGCTIVSLLKHGMMVLFFKYTYISQLTYQVSSLKHKNQHTFLKWPQNFKQQTIITLLTIKKKQKRIRIIKHPRFQNRLHEESNINNTAIFCGPLLGGVPLGSPGSYLVIPRCGP